jgi:pimeloyl-ACP methyl ester carboxylesterase
MLWPIGKIWAVFRPFSRGGAETGAQIHGTGLGLFMVREALVSMGGSVSVKSAPGKGRVFAIHLPGSSVSVQPSAPGEGNPNDATLILAGRFDRVAIPKYAVQFKQFMPQATFVMFEKSGHAPFNEEAELCPAKIPYLGELALGRLQIILAVAMAS